MPNRDVHIKVGVGLAVSSTIVVAIASKEELSFEDICMRMLGAAFGGYVGARLPDVIDPSSRGPNHRSVGHGIAPNGALYALCSKKFLATRKILLEEPNPQSRIGNQFMVGAMDGFIAGHASHLVLDSRTPKGLPAFL